MNDMIEKSLEYIKQLFEKDFSGHDYYHSLRVCNLAVHIHQIEGGNLLKVQLAAILHDVDDVKLFKSSERLENARQFMQDNHLDEALIEDICSIIKSVSFNGSGADKPSSLEGMIVQDADRLDAIGAVGIARAFAYGGSHQRSIHLPDELPQMNMTAEEYRNNKGTSINHFYEKLLKLKDLMNTGEAKRIAEKRHRYMLNYLTEFLAEWEGCR